jgi:3-dehydroquinate dehydratase
MSVQEFSNALKSAALKSWFQRLSTDNILKMSSKDIRKKESGKEFNSFYITNKTISDIIEKLSGVQASPEQVTKVFANLAKAKYGKGSVGKTITEPYIDGKALYYPRISMDNISSILDTGFEDVLTEAKVRNPDISISSFFQKGHVFGIFPKKLAQTRKSLATNTTLTDQARSLLVGFLSDLEKQLEEEDLATSNLKTSSYGLYAKYKKRTNSYLVEMQLVETNEEAGRAQAPLAKAVRKYLNPGAISFTSTGIKFTEGSAEQRIKQLMLDNVEKLIGTKGSPSMLDLIKASIVDSLNGKTVSKKEYYSPNVKVIQSKASKVDTKDAKAKIKKDLDQVRKLKQSVKAVPRFQKDYSETLSLVSLQLLINTHLQDVISANMGTGNDPRILNYQTGRFAASAKVERMSQSREGMITAFYSYMKNPYQTFEPGYRQGSPKTRDPKLLIAGSIREIAASKVGNRMRAVLL